MQAHDFASIFEWCYAHLALVGYTAVAVFVWKARGWFMAVTTTAQTAVDQIHRMSDEHFPAMKESLRTQDGVLKSVDESLKTLVQGQVQFSTAQPVRRKRKK